MTSVLVFGSNGKMGTHVRNFISQSKDVSLFCGVDGVSTGKEEYTYFQTLEEVKGRPDVIIDFSFHRLIGGLLDYAKSIKCPVIVCTTGFDEAEKAQIIEASKCIPVFWSSNMSMGIALLVDFAKKAAENFPNADIEIVEAHHNRKIDAPSGTALMIAEGIKEVRPKANFVCGRSGEAKRDVNDIGIHALRMANIVGEHEVFITTETQQLVLKHTAYDRALFAEGAVKVAPFMKDKPCGLYNMKDFTQRG